MVRHISAIVQLFHDVREELEFAPDRVGVCARACYAHTRLYVSCRARQVSETMLLLDEANELITKATLLNSVGTRTLDAMMKSFNARAGPRGASRSRRGSLFDSMRLNPAALGVDLAASEVRGAVLLLRVRACRSVMRCRVAAAAARPSLSKAGT